MYGAGASVPKRRHRREVRLHDIHAVLIRALVAGEEMNLVLSDRTAEHESSLLAGELRVVSQRYCAPGSDRPRCRCRGSSVPRASERVGARARHDVDGAEGGDARRQVEVRGRNLKLLHDFLREVLTGAPFDRVADVPAIYRNRRARRRATQDGHVELRVELRRVSDGHRHARLHRGKVQEAASVQRKVVNLRPPDNALYRLVSRSTFVAVAVTVTASVLPLTCSVA